MKQKIDNSITKKDLFSAFKEFRDLVRKDIKEEISASEKRTDIKLERLELQIDDKAQQYRNDVLTKFDTWASELENARQDRTLDTQHIHELHEDVDNLKSRVTELETAQN